MGKEPTVPIVYEAGWAPESVRTLWRKEKSYTAEYLNTAIQIVARRYTDWAIAAPNY
jgi:hypothetical protein